MYIILCVYFWTALFGACIGSFLNVVVYRLPKGSFFAEARSYCPACKEQLGWRELVPVFSFLFQKGRCMHCGARISARYPLVEAASAVLAVISFARFGFDARAPLSFGVMAVLLAVALIDHDTMEIPDSLVLALLTLAVYGVWAFRDISLMERVIGFFVISLPMLLTALVVVGAFGGGDVKLMAACGFLLGWRNTLLAFFIALLFSGGYACWLLATGKAKRGAKLAFGPYLCAGVAAALLWGGEIIRFYLDLFI